MQRQYSFKFFMINFFTIFRILVSPFVFMLLIINGVVNSILAFVLFMVGTITDAIDGMLARKYNLQSKFGFVLDPIADKFLVLFTLLGIILIDYFFVPFYFFVIIFLRDLIVTFLKPISDYKGFPIPTTSLAKIKTTIQFVCIISVLMYNILVNVFVGNPSVKSVIEFFGSFAYLPYYLCLVLLIVTIVSGIEYIVLFIRGVLKKLSF
ncbi:MAG: CDP-alcohol phosphatidyltransferase family protein [Brevinematia bacterium]